LNQLDFNVCCDSILNAVIRENYLTFRPQVTFTVDKGHLKSKQLVPELCPSIP